MPEYLAPGVFVEETSYRYKPIEGVSTSTTSFVGPTRDGPIFGEPPLLTSYQEFQEIYGGMDPLEYDGSSFTNFVAQAVRAYFEEGGRRLYVARAFEASDDAADEPTQATDGSWSDGIARWDPEDDSFPSGDGDSLKVAARYPGAAGNRLVALKFRLGPNVLDDNATPLTLKGVQRFDVVWVEPSAAAGAPDAGLYWADRFFDPQGRPGFRLRRDNPASAPDSDTIMDLGIVGSVRLLTVSVTVEGRGRYRGRFDLSKTYEDLALHPGQLAPGSRRTLVEAFASDPARRSTALFVPITMTTTFSNGVGLATLLTSRASITGRPVVDSLGRAARGEEISDPELTTTLELRGGNDGERPSAGSYQGRVDASAAKSGLLALEDLEDISIVCAPGSTYGALNGYRDQARAIVASLLSHCERMRYRVAVLDSYEGAVPSEVREQRAALDNKYGALYYPWVRTVDPISEVEITLPPSGFVAGIYARSDVDRGVHKAPANEVIRLATGFETSLNKGQQEGLNPLGINCLRFFEGRGFRVWGARAITSDGEWKYINLRRNFAYIGRSIEIGTQWAVFEPNAEELWANVRRAVESFLYNEWRSRRLMGVTPDEAFFVRCDRTTMTQADIDNGRLICLVGVALLRPAEFVIFRIGQKTIEFKD